MENDNAKNAFKNNNNSLKPTSSDSTMVAVASKKSSATKYLPSRLCVHSCVALLLLGLWSLNHRLAGTSLPGTTKTTGSRLPMKNISVRKQPDSHTQGKTSMALTADTTPTSSLSSVTNGSGLTPHAKQVLLTAAKDRLQELETLQQNNRPALNSNVRPRSFNPNRKNANKKRNNNNNNEKGDNQNFVPPLLTKKSTDKQQRPSSSHQLPPLESLIDGNGNIIGDAQDIQFLLDFAVMGFGKCGTTTLLQWLQTTNVNSTSSSQVRAPSYEAQFLVKRRPAQLVTKMYNFYQEEQDAKLAGRLAANDKIFKGFKNPSDIRRPHSRAFLRHYWPRTPLIVTVRQPVDWLVSIYNYYKIEKGRLHAALGAKQMLQGRRDGEGNTPQYVSTAKGEFHAILAELGKTSLATSDEWQLLEPWLSSDPAVVQHIHQNQLPNPIFLLEMNQLQDANATRAQQFAHDLEAFLGFPSDQLLPTPLHVRPNTDHISKAVKRQADDLKMNICLPEFAPVLEEMMKIATAASTWLQDYFLASDDVTVSSPDYLRHLLEQWKINPCDTS